MGRKKALSAAEIAIENFKAFRAEVERLGGSLEGLDVWWRAASCDEIIGNLPPEGMAARCVEDERLMAAAAPALARFAGRAGEESALDFSLYHASAKAVDAQRELWTTLDGLARAAASDEAAVRDGRRPWGGWANRAASAEAAAKALDAAWEDWRRLASIARKDQPKGRSAIGLAIVQFLRGGVL